MSYYPHSYDMLIMSCPDILTVTSPATSNGCAFLLSAEDMDAATGILVHSHSKLATTGTVTDARPIVPF